MWEGIQQYKLTRLPHKRITKLILRSLGVRNAFEHFIGWLDEQVRKRETGEKVAKREDMLEYFRSIRDANGQTLTHAEVMVEAINLLGAGADTTSIGIRAVLAQLLQHPDVYRAVQAEVDGVFRVR